LSRSWVERIYLNIILAMFESDFSFFDLIVVGQDNLSTLVHNLNNTTDLKLARFTLSKTSKRSKVEEMVLNCSLFVQVT
jgi:hypothetical protein